MRSTDVITNQIGVWASAFVTKPNGGRRASNKRETHGIRRLRELILELAVRGKLVEQDLNDEPADLLLRRAREEKQQALGAKATKQDKGSLPIASADEPFALPRGWVLTRLGDIAISVKSGGTPSKHNAEFWNGDIPWASVKDLGFGDPVSKTQDQITYAGLSAGSCLAEAGSILICTRMGLGKIGEAEVDVAFNQDLKAVRLASGVNKRFFIDYYRTLSITGTGMTVAGIRQEELLNFVVPLPPFAEQARIVKRVDEIMAMCDRLEREQADSLEAHQTLVEAFLNRLKGTTSEGEKFDAWSRVENHFDDLFSSDKSVQQLKQTILQLAVTGQLIAQDPQDEPADLLLERISEGKQVMLQAKQIRQGKISRPQTARGAPVGLPCSWKWVNVDSLCYKVTDGTHFTPQYVESGVRFVSAKDIVGGKLSFSDCRYISQEEHDELFRRCNPGYHDIVISKSGSIGSVALIEDSDEFSLFESLALLKFDQTNLVPQYLVYALSHACSMLTNGHIRGVGVKHLHLDVLRGIELGLPPLAEQHRIVAKLDELMVLCSSLKVALGEANKIQAHLADAVVEQLA